MSVSSPELRSVSLSVLDGRGYREESGSNAIAAVHPPVWDRWWAEQPRALLNGLREYTARLGLRQLRLAASEKYALPTIFFNGGVEQPPEMGERSPVAESESVE